MTKPLTPLEILVLREIAEVGQPGRPRHVPLETSPRTLLQCIGVLRKRGFICRAQDPEQPEASQVSITEAGKQYLAGEISEPKP